MVQQELAAEKRIVLRFAPLHGVLPLRQPVPVRDLDRAQDALQPLREHPQAGRGRPRSRAPPGPEQAGTGARQPGVQLHHPHRPVRPRRAAALPLAHRDHPPVDQGRRLRVGLGLLHQSRAPGERGRLPARGRSQSHFDPRPGFVRTRGGRAGGSRPSRTRVCCDILCWWTVSSEDRGCRRSV